MTEEESFDLGLTHTHAHTHTHTHTHTHAHTAWGHSAHLPSLGSWACSPLGSS